MIETVKKFLPQKKLRVLDVGIGDGRNAQYFVDKGHEVVGVDFSSKAIALCEKRFGNKVELLQLDMTTENACAFFQEKSFDLIVDWSVMDHVRRSLLSPYLFNLHSCLKLEGYLLSIQFELCWIKILSSNSNKDWAITHGGHYSRGWKNPESLQKTILDYLRDLPDNDYKKIFAKQILEQTFFNLLLLQKQ
ncbi:MAG: class I SAM-dependent methyltransferase [Candidatus Pacebacteria bacterium]|nr:class I SAM-dependent methyltransferase [Candidatus Paceibacterota bacterium]